MSTPRRTLIIAALLLFTSMAMPVASAQPGLLPGIEVTCNNSETAVNFNVLQTSVLTVFCTIENPTLYSEEVEIEYDATGLAATGLESTTLAAGDDLQFEVVITAPDGGDTQPAEFNITVTATVTSVQGIDCGPTLLCHRNRHLTELSQVGSRWHAGQRQRPRPQHGQCGRQLFTDPQ
jgi:hypothetical protein